MSEDSKHSIGGRYLLISPCRNEGQYLPVLIGSVVAQTLPPEKWVIVDDGSSDDTPQILDRAAAEHPLIEIIRREDRGGRSVGAGVIDAFYSGLANEDLSHYDYLCKLDSDIDLPPRYFERLLAEMKAEPFLGTVSGKVYLQSPSGKLTHERRGDENSVGPAKFYRVQCFQEIGGFVRAIGWDGIDGHMCRKKGWIAKSVGDPELRIIHRRQMGSSQRNVLVGRMRGGAGKWFIGSSPLFVIATAIYRLIDPPYVVGAVMMLIGYFRAMVRREPRFGDKVYRSYLRRYELESLLIGKRRATQRRNDQIRAARTRANT